MNQCQCDLRIKLVGDGCRYCNPQEFIDHLIDELNELRTWNGLTDSEITELIKKANGYYEFADVIDDLLREKNR